MSAKDIDRVVNAFYAEVRHEPTLSGVFAPHVQNWHEHEDKIASFWRNAILHERSYDGNPMQKHMMAGNVKPAHFSIWLAIFDKVLSEQLAEPESKAWSQLAHRIGQGLRFGLINYGETPDLS